MNQSVRKSGSLKNIIIPVHRTFRCGNQELLYLLLQEVVLLLTTHPPHTSFELSKIMRTIRFIDITVAAVLLVSFITIRNVSSFAMECPPDHQTKSINSVQLSFRENALSQLDSASSSQLPPTLFLHGLDSSSHTWRHNLEELGSRAVALDLRGCGNSPLGDPEDFSPDALVDDIHAFLCSHPYFCHPSSDNNYDLAVKENSEIIPFVIVGHSMGGRIAMSFATRYPEYIKALVIEDMDVRTRPMEMNAFQSKSQNRTATVNFDRCLDEMEHEDELVDVFAEEGYPEALVKKWLKEGRLELMEDGSYYSHVNPAFRLLCYEHFFVTTHGEDTWMRLVTLEPSTYERKRTRRFPTHVMVADKEKTVCNEESLWFMKDAMKKADRFMVLHRYKDATHSIHNSAREKFLVDLRTILRTAALGNVL